MSCDIPLASEVQARPIELQSSYVCVCVCVCEGVGGKHQSIASPLTCFSPYSKVKASSSWAIYPWGNVSLSQPHSQALSATNNCWKITRTACTS